MIFYPTFLIWLAPLYKKELLLGLVILAVGTFCYHKNYIAHTLDAYGCSSAQEAFGDRLLAPEKEALVQNIAQEMGVSERFIIRKMNRTALLTFGYHNAFAYFPAFLNIIPISNTPFLFISEGFFEDLSPAEQRFLIGHEMAHIKGHHLQYLQLSLLLLQLSMFVCCWLFRHRMRAFVQKAFEVKYQWIMLRIITCALIFFSLLTPKLIDCWYRKYREREADYTSLTLLQSHEGFLQLINRWEKEFKAPLHNPYFGLFSSHPSNHERKTYCLKLHHKS
jgi:Zn-dependent protease with chaperone function